MKLETSLDEIIEDNTRFIQNINKREILYFDNHCKIKKPRKIKSKGHFEKIEQKLTNYFYVSDNKSSGVPNAFVVSPAEALGLKKTNSDTVI